MTVERAIAQDIETIVRQEQEHDEAGNSKFGFIVFLLSESVIFLSFFVGYIVYKTTAIDWYPLGVTGLDVSAPRVNTIVLVSSSFVIYVAERYLHDKKLWGFRLFLLATIAMGSYFLYGQAVEWRSLSFWVYIRIIRRHVLFAYRIPRTARTHGHSASGIDDDSLVCSWELRQWFFWR
jgi:cytochrome c oxidase subunit III